MVECHHIIIICKFFPSKSLGYSVDGEISLWIEQVRNALALLLDVTSISPRLEDSVGVFKDSVCLGKKVTLSVSHKTSGEVSLVDFIGCTQADTVLSGDLLSRL